MGREKNGIGNRGLKELIYTTHGHELKEGECWRVGWGRDEGVKRKNWENCNSIIYEKYLKNK